MGIQGRLTRDKMASTMPVDSPAYSEKPFHYEDAHVYLFEYETDGDAVAELLPEQLSLTDPPTATLAFIDFKRSSLGSYREVGLGVNVDYKGEPMRYALYLFLDQDVPILAGREIYGYPKKKAIISFKQEEDLLVMAAERPEGIQICSAVFRDTLKFDPLPQMTETSIVLRVIPSPEENKRHSLLELILIDDVIEKGRVSMGSGNCYLTGMSELDPWHKVPVKKMISCSHMIADSTLSYGRIAENLLST